MKLNNVCCSSLFFGNYFCYIEKHDMAFVTISKNGVTFLKNVAIFDKYGYIPETEDETHAIVGNSPELGFLYTFEQIKQYEQENGALLKFAVWRDPVERLVSCYKYFILEKEYRNYFCYLGLYEDNSFDRFMEFVEFELKKTNPLFQDEHFRRQSDCYRPEDVDYIVPIRKLNQFLAEHGVELQEDKANETKVHFEFPCEKWEKRIKELYAADYEIKPDY